MYHTSTVLGCEQKYGEGLAAIYIEILRATFARPTRNPRYDTSQTISQRNGLRLFHFYQTGPEI